MRTIRDDLKEVRVVNRDTNLVDSDHPFPVTVTNPITTVITDPLETTLVNSEGNEIFPATEIKQDSQIVLETALNAIQEIIKNTVTTNDKTHLLLQQIRDSISMRPDYVEASNTQAVSGAVTVSGSLTTITTLTGQTNIGGFSADMITENNSYQDWGSSIRSLII